MVARQMEGHRERIATRIRREAAKRGESAPDLAHALGVYPSTAERWFRGDRTPQRRHRKDLAEHWGLEPDWAEIDLATEEQDVRDQLDRIEEALEDLVGATALLLADAGDQKIARRKRIDFWLDRSETPTADREQIIEAWVEARNAYARGEGPDPGASPWEDA